MITGGCGFVGVNLVKFLLEKDKYNLRVLDNLSAGKKESLEKVIAPLGAPVELVIGDIRDRAIVNQSIAGIDWVVHLAAHTSVVESLENPEEDFDINVKGTLNLLEASRQEGVQAFIFGSSSAVVGEQVPPLNEKMVPQPLSPYGAAKLAGEGLCFSYSRSFDLKTLSLRFANAYGPYCEHKTSVVARFMKWAQEGEPLIIYGDGNQTRDFIEARDVCQATYLSLQALEAGSEIRGEVFQIATEVETRINDLAQLIKKVVGKEITIIHHPSRKGEMIRNFADVSKARRVLGFKPEIGLRQGLEDLWSWFQHGI